MQVDRWQKIEYLFNEALKLPSGQRNEYLAKNCAEDSGLRHEVSKLLKETDSPDDFLSNSAFSLGAQLLDEEFEVLLRNTDFGFYQLKQLLGRGGVGAVFKANDKRLGRRVALKILPAVLSDSDERVLRFRQEARLASAITHPNIAHIYEFGSFKGYYFLAMEYFPGKTLRYYLKNKSIDLHQTLQFVAQIAGALEAAHDAGIIHRDIKPENIVIVKNNLVKILDFGLAKIKHSLKNSHHSNRLFDSTLITTPGLIIGTVAYMSPEQAENKNIDERTDLWSLGVLFYEMLTGVHPFLNDSNIETLHHILKEPPNKLSEVSQRVPQNILNVALKCLEKSKDNRYQSARELIDEIETIQKTETRLDRRKNGSGESRLMKLLTRWIRR
ncbi:MAG: serine/threonine protein kinase [Pyrinomonadaceae bacterium]|nr:serine/threonine protein kinase [Pyrinomonadaceae bacterium]